MVDYIRDLRLAKWGSGRGLHGSNPEPLMSALGQKQTLQSVRPMSALPPKADIGTQPRMSALCQKQTYAVQQFGQFVVSPQNKTLLVLLAGRCCEPTVGSR